MPTRSPRSPAKRPTTKPAEGIGSPQAVAFTHLPVPDESIFDDQDGLRGWVEVHWGDSLRAFARCRSLKLVYLFLSNAYTKLLSDADDLPIAGANEVLLRRALEEYFRGMGWKERKFVLVGLDELVPLLKPMDTLSHNSGRQDLKDLFLGKGQKLFYDCPKVIEALIRIARRHIDPRPILRFDEDVRVNDEAVQRLIATYDKERREEGPYCFFSGTYRVHDRNRDLERFLLNDYSVRVHFFGEGPGGSLDAYLEREGFDPRTAMTERGREVRDALKGREGDRFVLDAGLAERFLRDIVRRFGPDVYNQPVSGAGLCISPLAISQLPPFANVATNIMWIDDALKQSLHMGLGDLQRDRLRAVAEARFEQDRHPRGVTLKDVLWAYENYLPRLVSGLLMSSLMFDVEAAEGPGAFAESFRKYMSSRRIPTMTDRRDWKRVAIAHLRELRRAICGHPCAKRGSWRMLAAWAEVELDMDRPGCREIVDAIVAEPGGQERDRRIAKLCARHRLPEGRNAGAYVAGVLSDLQRYVELVDLWPHIVRTIDFQVRDAPKEHWLREPELL